MPPRMTTRSAGRPTIASQGGGTGRRAGRGGGRTRGRSGDQGNGRIDGQSVQVGGQGSEVNDGVDGRSNGDAINDNIRGDARNVIDNNDNRGCTYKKFLACNPKEYDWKGGVVVYTRWIEKMESIRTLGREVDVGMSLDNFKVLMKEEFCPSNEMQKLETEL
ncbi:hypothetical protein Tco_0410628 [Tanacetum coccineum]